MNGLCRKYNNCVRQTPENRYISLLSGINGPFTIPGYIRGCAALGVLVVFTDFFGSLLTGLGLRSTDPNKKYKYYRVAIYCLILCGNYVYRLIGTS